MGVAGTSASPRKASLAAPTPWSAPSTPRARSRPQVGAVRNVVDAFLVEGSIVAGGGTPSVAALVVLGIWLLTPSSESNGDAAAAFGVAANVLVASVLVWVTYNYVVVTEGLLTKAANERHDRRDRLSQKGLVQSVVYRPHPVGSAGGLVQHDVTARSGWPLPPSRVRTLASAFAHRVNSGPLPGGR